MADFPMDGRVAPETNASFGAMAQLAGAVVSVALVLGVGVWGYKIMVRDVSGIPVVKAALGPARVAPEDPGGETAVHQGLAVNAVAAGAEEVMPDQLVLAPGSAQLTDEDVAGLNSAPEVAPAPAPVAAATSEPEIPADMTPTEALLAKLTANETPLSDLEDVVARAPAARAPETGPETVAFRPSLSPRPLARPSTLTAPPAVKAALATSAARDVRELEAAALPAGTRLVQLGAFDSPETARAEWARIAGGFASFFTGKDRVIQRAESGGKTFYRLRAHGFDDLADTRRFCAALMAKRVDCIPVVTR